MAIVQKAHSVALAIAAILDDWLTSQDDSANVGMVQPHLNGRERGLCYSVSREGARAAYVYEHRSSDNIVVTFSKHTEWPMVTEEEYGASKHFQYDEHHKAAMYMHKFLLQEKP